MDNLQWHTKKVRATVGSKLSAAQGMLAAGSLSEASPWHLIINILIFRLA